jgi:uncharacterized membrane-anchored protein YitT (DUF2179 family)
MTRSSKMYHYVKHASFFILGSLLAAVGLDIFLVPNNIIDGGITGISIISSHLSHLPLGMFIILLNIPFLYIGYKQIGRTFAFSTLFSILWLSVWVSILHSVPVLTKDVFLASIFGGVILGIGVGLIIRYGGSLDGTEIIAILVDKKSGFSVGEIVMFFNLFILTSAGFVFGWDKALYSLITYFVAFKIIDITIEGLDESKAVFIISNKGEDIAKQLMSRLGRGVTYLEGMGGYSKEKKNIIYLVVTRLEIAKLKEIINETDPEAFLTISGVHDVMGVNYKEKAVH